MYKDQKTLTMINLNLLEYYVKPNWVVRVGTKDKQRKI